MNKERRKRIELVIEQLDEIEEEVESIAEEEEIYLENMPENLHGSERYEQASEYLDSLRTSIDYISEVRDPLSSIIE